MKMYEVTRHDQIEALVEAKRLISSKESWTQGEFARDSDGQVCSPYSKDAVCWCAQGAINAACEKVFNGKMELSSLYHAMARNNLGHVVNQTNSGWVYLDEYNDDPETTHGDVIKAFSEAIEFVKDRQRKESEEGQ